MNDWKKIKLEEICDVFTDGDWIERKDQSSSGIRLIQTGNIGRGVFLNKKAKSRFITTDTAKRLNCTTVFPGDLLISRLPDPVGRACIIPDIGTDMITAVDCTIIRVNESIVLPSFLLFYTKSLDYFTQINRFLSGTTRKRISRGNLAKIEIPIPPIDYQKKIVVKIEELLGKLDEAKGLRTEAQKEVKNLLAAVVKKIIRDGGNDGWERKKIGDISEVNPKKSEIKHLDDNMIVSFIPMAAVDEHLQKIITFNERQLSDLRKGYTYFKEDDVLFAKITPCMENGKVAIARNLKNGIGFGTTEFHVIRAGKNVLPEWIYTVVRQPSFREKAKKKMTGSAGQKRVPKEFIESYEILIPPINEQKKIISCLNNISEKIEQVEGLQKNTSSEFVECEESILTQAFKGELL